MLVKPPHVQDSVMAAAGLSLLFHVTWCFLGSSTLTTSHPCILGPLGLSSRVATAKCPSAVSDSER